MPRDEHYPLWILHALKHVGHWLWKGYGRWA